MKISNKYFSLTLIIVALLIFSCNCGGPRGFVPQNTLPKEISSERLLNRFFQERTVSVYRDCTLKDNAVVFGMSRSQADRAYDGRGTGVIIKSKAKKSYILTAYHVVKNGHPKALSCEYYIITDKLISDKKIPVKIRWHSNKKDYAILYLNKNLKVSSALNTSPYLGMKVFSVGYGSLPGSSDVKVSITDGTLATKDVKLNGVKSDKLDRVTSQIYFGNSGGGVWGKDGRLVGITVVLVGVNAWGSRTMPYEGNYYIEPAREIFSDLCKHNKRLAKELFDE